MSRKLRLMKALNRRQSMNGYTHWEYEPETRAVFAPDIEDGITLATVEPYDDADDIGKLIAAAPEMYRLLQNFCYPEEPITTRTLNLSNRAWELLRRIDGEEAKDDCD